MTAEWQRLHHMALQLRRRMPYFMELDDLVSAGWLGLQHGGWHRAHGAMLDEIRLWYGNGRRDWEGNHSLPAKQLQLAETKGDATTVSLPLGVEPVPSWDKLASYSDDEWHRRVEVSLDLSVLPPGERAVMELLLEDQPFADIADRTGKSVNAVRIAQTRAIERLRTGTLRRSKRAA